MSAPLASVSVTFTSITNPTQQYRHTFAASATIIAITNWLLHKLQQSSNDTCHLVQNGVVLAGSRVVRDLADADSEVHLHYFLSNQINTNNDAPLDIEPNTALPSIQTVAQSAATPPLPLPANHSQSLLQYYTQLQQQHPAHYQMLLAQYPYLQQELDQLRASASTPHTPNVQQVHVQPHHQPAAAAAPLAAAQQNNAANVFNLANLWRFLHIQLILKISILLFLFCQNGDIYRTVLMCIVAAIAYLYQVGAFGRAAAANADAFDEDGFEVIPDNVRQQAERDENARRQRAENAANGVAESTAEELPPSWWLNTEKFIVGLFASLWPDWQPHVLMPNNRRR